MKTKIEQENKDGVNTEVSNEQDNEEGLARIFLDEFKQLVDKHGFDFFSVLNYTDTGIYPRIIIKRIPKE